MSFRITVDERRGQRGDLDYRRAKTHHRRDAEGAGEDRGVGVDAALLRRETEQVPAVHRGRVRRREVIGEQDVLSFRRLVIGILVDLEISQHALADILDVRGALTEIRIRDAPHRLEEILHHCVERVFRILLARGDGFLNTLQQCLVLKQHHVRLEDLTVRIAGKRFQSLLEIGQLLLGGTDCFVEAFLLMPDVLLRNLVDLGSGKTARNHMNGADSNTWGCRYPPVCNFLIYRRLCHLLTEILNIITMRCKVSAKMHPWLRLA